MRVRLARTMLLVLTPTLGLAVCRVTAAGEGRTAPAPRAKRIQAVRLPQAPRIDGRLENLWQSAARTVEFEGLGGMKLTQGTEAYVGHSQGALYVAFMCRESRMSQIIAAARERDAVIYGDDCVEVFIDANNDLKTYYQFQISSRGTFTDRKCEIAETGQVFKRARWDAEGAEWATACYPNHWVAEMKFPLSSLGLKAGAGLVFGLNLTRAEYPHKETSSWASMGTTYHNPKLFGRLWFERALFIDRARVLDEAAGTVKLEVQATNAGRDRVDADLVLVFKNPQEGEVQKAKKIELAPRETKSIVLEHPLGYGGDSAIRVELRDRQTGTRYDAAIVTMARSGGKPSGKYVTPHTQWAKPTPGGKIRALFLLRYFNQRDVIELAQRLDLDYESPIFIRRYWAYPEKPSAKEYLATVLDALDKDLDVIVIGRDLAHKKGPYSGACAPLSKEAVERIKEKVAQGTGAVIYAQEGMPTEWQENLVTGCDRVTVNRKAGVAMQVQASHYLTQGVDFSLFSILRLPVFDTGDEVLVTAGDRPFLAANRHGKGRVLILGYSPNGMVPPRPSGPTYREWGPSPTSRYWDYYFAFMAKCLYWASGREPEVEISSLESQPSVLRQDTEDAAVALSLSATGRGGDYQVQLVVRDKFSNKVAELAETLKLTAGATGEMRFPLPENSLIDGLHFAEVVVRKQEQVVNWGFTTFTVASLPRIEAIVPAQEYYDQPGQIFRGEVKLTRSSGRQTDADMKVRVLLRDRVGRVLGKTLPLPVPRTEPELTVQVPISNPVWRSFRAEATLKAGNRVMDMAISKPLYYIPDRETDDFSYFLWNWNHIESHPDYVHFFFYRRLLDCGINGIEGYYSLDYPILQGLSFLGSKHSHLFQAAGQNQDALYHKTKDTKYLTRSPCLSDPGAVRTNNQKNEKKLGQMLPQKPIGYFFGDEDTLAYEGKPLDLCFSEHCLRAFRGWLKREYGTLAALNGEWDAAFRSWEDVLPMTKEQVHDRGNYSPWADHRHFMQDAWTSAYAGCRDWLLARDPQAKVGACGTRPLAAYSGIDWYKQLKVLSFLVPYSIVKKQAEVHRSFSAAPKIMASGLTEGKRQTYFVWKAALNDCFGVIFSKTSYAVRPDLSLTAKARFGQRVMGEFTRGLGKILRTSERDQGRIGLYYSPASCFGSWITEYRHGRRPVWRGPFHRARGSWLKLIQDMGLQCRFVHPDQVKEGFLEKNDLKVLVLPYSLAMGDDEIAQIESFVRHGGTLIADYRPAAMDWHCRVRETGGLDGLLGVRSLGAPRSDFVEGKTVGRDAAPGDQRSADILSVVSTPGVELGTGVALAEFKQEYAGETPAAWPAVIMNRAGKGRTYLLNFLYDYRADYTDPAAQPLDRNLRALLKGILAEIGVRSPLTITADGKEQSYLEVVPYSRGQTRYYFILQNYLFPQGHEDLSRDSALVRFPAQSFVYDVRKGKFLGKTDTAEAVLKPGEACAFALLPYAVKSLDIRGPDRGAPGEVLAFEAKVSANGRAAGDHVVRMDVSDPDGNVLRHYSRNLLAISGTTSFAIPLALNDRVGKWRITVTDIVSGVTAGEDLLVEAGVE